MNGSQSSEPLKLIWLIIEEFQYDLKKEEQHDAKEFQYDLKESSINIFPSHLELHATFYYKEFNFYLTFFFCLLRLRKYFSGILVKRIVIKRDSSQSFFIGKITREKRRIYSKQSATFVRARTTKGHNSFNGSNKFGEELIYNHCASDVVSLIT